MKQVLFVSYHFPPNVAGGIPRIVDTVRLLPAHGWHPTVLTSSVAGKPAAIDHSALAAIPADVHIARAYCPFARLGTRGATQTAQGVRGRTKRALTWLSSLMFVPDRYAIWSVNALQEARTLSRRAGRRFDAVLSTFGPGSDLVVGHVISSMLGIPHIVDFRDLWSDSPSARFASDLHRRAVEKLERTIVRAAARVVTVSDGMSDHLAARHGVPRSQITTVTNGIDEDLLRLVRDERTADGPLRLYYTGSIYAGYDVNPFFQALGELKRAGEINAETFRVHFVGNLSADAPRAHGVEDLVVSEPFVPREQVFAKLAAADALLAVEGGGYWAKFGYPVKLFDYLMTGKPILGLLEPGGNSARLVEQLGSHFLAQPHAVPEISAALRQLIRTRGAALRPVDLSAPPLSHFRRSALVGRLAQTLDAAMLTTKIAA
jgi:glycosyltransferase involved in cell wall biosynthesis